MKNKNILLRFCTAYILCFGGFRLVAQTIHPHYLDGALYVEFKKESLATQTKSLANVNYISVNTLPFVKTDVKTTAIQSYAMPLSLSFSNVLDGVFSIRIEDPTKIDEVIQDLRKNPNIVNVEKVPLAFLCNVASDEKDVQLNNGSDNKSVNDPFYGKVGGLNLKWHLDMVRAEEAWKIQEGKPHIKVAVIDNAIWGEHEDLQIPAENQYNTSFPDALSAPPQNLNQDTECSKESLEQAKCEVFAWSHGTHCAGIVGAINTNEKGIASLGSGVTLLAVSSPGIMQSYLGDAYAAMRWAANKGAKVISCSWAMYSSTTYGRNMIKEMIDNNIILVTAAGNESNGNMFMYPAAYPGVISVGSCDANKNRSGFSNYGNWVDIMAPGGAGLGANEGIFSTTFCKNQTLRIAREDTVFNGKYYDNMQGTSMAAPLVASLCGLLLSKDSTITPYDMQELLISTAQKGGNLGIMETSGIIDAYAALQAVSGRIKRIMPEYFEYFTGVCESGYPKLYWEIEDTTDKKPDFLRLYRNGILIADTISLLDEGAYTDTGARMNMLHRYEICGVSQTVESFRKEAYVEVGTYFEVKAQANPLTGGSVYGSGRYENRSYASLEAKPNDGYKFVRWEWLGQWANENWAMDSVISLKIEREYLGIQAVFEQKTYLENILSASTLSLYPNPVTDQLYFEVDINETIESITIYDLSGRKSHYAHRPTENTISLSELKAGVYVLQLTSNKGSYTHKIVKK